MNTLHNRKKQKHVRTEPYRLPMIPYYMLRCMKSLPFFWSALSRTESWVLFGHIHKFAIDRPVYILGLSRSGTTITLEILSRHPDVATHRYVDYVFLYVPWFASKLLSIFSHSNEIPVERAHKDRIMVTRYSPKSVEEVFWIRYFKGLHDETQSNILDSDCSNSHFEAYYQDHIKKLLISRNRTRYVTKANYNITRMGYLKRLFPNVRFVILIRNPVNHIASLIKQDRIIETLRSQHQRMGTFLRLMGNYEFGSARSCINPGNTDAIREIRRLWESGKTVQGWAIYWNMIYEFIANLLDSGSDLAKACLVVRYEDLCAKGGETFDRILEHCVLPAASFADIREEYSVHRLSAPTYYKPDFSEGELADICEITSKTAARFGYQMENQGERDSCEYKTINKDNEDTDEQKDIHIDPVWSYGDMGQTCIRRP